MQRVLVFGKNGQLASELREREQRLGTSLFVERDEIPLTDTIKLASLIKEFRPNSIVNCAAFTAVDKAEAEKEAAYLVNRDFVGRLAQMAADLRIPLVHFSTDYVFDGRAIKPYEVDDQTGPLGVYGASKLAGERAIAEAGGSATVLRTSWVYSKYGANFVKTMIRLANEEKTLRVVDDQIGCPTAAADLAEFVIEKVLPNPPKSPQLYHFSGNGPVSWNGFAREIATLWQTKQRDIVRIPTSEFPTPAKRPLYGVLSKTKTEKDFGVSIAHWRDSLRRRYQDWSLT